MVQFQAQEALKHWLSLTNSQENIQNDVQEKLKDPQFTNLQEARNQQKLQKHCFDNQKPNKPYLQNQNILEILNVKNNFVLKNSRSRQEHSRKIYSQEVFRNTEKQKQFLIKRKMMRKKIQNDRKFNRNNNSALKFEITINKEKENISKPKDYQNSEEVKNYEENKQKQFSSDERLQKAKENSEQQQQQEELNIFNKNQFTNLIKKKEEEKFNIQGENQEENQENLLQNENESNVYQESIQNKTNQQQKDMNSSKKNQQDEDLDLFLEEDLKSGDQNIAIQRLKVQDQKTSSFQKNQNELIQYRDDKPINIKDNKTNQKLCYELKWEEDSFDNQDEKNEKNEKNQIGENENKTYEEKQKFSKKNSKKSDGIISSCKQQQLESIVQKEPQNKNSNNQEEILNKLIQQKNSDDNVNMDQLKKQDYQEKLKLDKEEKNEDYQCKEQQKSLLENEKAGNLKENLKQIQNLEEELIKQDEIQKDKEECQK